MNLEVILSPLWEDLKKIGFAKFVVDTEFNRFCTKHQILDVLAKAKNVWNEEGSKDFLDMFLIDEGEALGYFLSELYSARRERFAKLTVELVAAFLIWTQRYVEIDDVVKDLQLLDTSDEDILILKNAYSNYNKDYSKKVKALYLLVGETIQSYPTDDGTYAKLRLQLINSPIKDKIPTFIFEIETLSACRPFLQQMESWRERREFLSAAFKPAFQFFNNTSVIEVSVSFDLHHIKDMWTKAIQRIDSDPAGAITAARSLLESVLKHICDMKGIEVQESFDLPKLYKAVSKKMNMTPDNASDTPINQFLKGATMMVDGLAGIRNILGDSHGTRASSARPSPRHAEMVVNLAGVLSNFLMRSLSEKHMGSTTAHS